MGSNRLPSLVGSSPIAAPLCTTIHPETATRKLRRAPFFAPGRHPSRLPHPGLDNYLVLGCRKWLGSDVQNRLLRLDHGFRSALERIHDHGRWFGGRAELLLGGRKS